MSASITSQLLIGQDQWKLSRLYLGLYHRSLTFKSLSPNSNVKQLEKKLSLQCKQVALDGEEKSADMIDACQWTAFAITIGALMMLHYETLVHSPASSESACMFIMQMISMPQHFDSDGPDGSDSDSDATLSHSLDTVAA